MRPLLDHWTAELKAFSASLVAKYNSFKSFIMLKVAQGLRYLGSQRWDRERAFGFCLSFLARGMDCSNGQRRSGQSLPGSKKAKGFYSVPPEGSVPHFKIKKVFHVP